jgi:hypothetical protein
LGFIDRRLKYGVKGLDGCRRLAGLLLDTAAVGLGFGSSSTGLNAKSLKFTC